jgi:hypothetical protein
VYDGGEEAKSVMGVRANLMCFMQNENECRTFNIGKLGGTEIRAQFYIHNHSTTAAILQKILVNVPVAHPLSY